MVLSLFFKNKRNYVLSLGYRQGAICESEVKLPTINVFSSGQKYFKNLVVKLSVLRDLATANSFKALKASFSVIKRSHKALSDKIEILVGFKDTSSSGSLALSNFCDLYRDW